MSKGLRASLKVLLPWPGDSVGCSDIKRLPVQIPGQSTWLSCWFSPWSGRIWEATNQCYSLLPCLLSKLIKTYLQVRI